MIRKSLIVLVFLVYHCDEVNANAILVRKRDEHQTEAPSPITSNKNDIATRKAVQRRRRHPSLPSSVRLVGDEANKSIQDTSLRLGSESLADRWSFILDRAPCDGTPSFAAQIRALEESTHSGRKSKAGSNKKKKHNPRSLQSISWSIALSTGTILAMTSMSHLSSLAMSIPNSNEDQTQFAWWKCVLVLLNAEYDITSSKITKYVRKKLLPIGLETLQKMVLMELWRAFWLKIFAGLRDLHHSLFKESYYESVWENYAPGWLRRGVRAYFVKKVQADLQVTLGSWIGKGWDLMGGSLWLDFQFVQDGEGDNDDAYETETIDDTDSFDGTSLDGSDGGDLAEIEMEVDDIEVDIDDAGVDIDDTIDMEG